MEQRGERIGGFMVDSTPKLISREGPTPKPVIYILGDPRNNAVKYVGYTSNFANRMHYHYRSPTPSRTKIACHAYPWLLELADLGMLPVSKIVEVIEEGADWEERERHWIAHYKNLNEPLLNHTIGGRGNKQGAW